MDELAHVLVKKLTQQHLTIGSCESFTAGQFCSTIADIPGASAVLKGGLVTYATELKKTIAHVDVNVIDTYGVVSEECATAMATCAKKVLDVDICVSFTGNAGPSAWENKPAGLVYCAIAFQDKVSCYELMIDKERNALRGHAVNFMIQKMILLLESLEREEMHEEREE